MANFSRSTWRLIIQPPATGAVNMAVDEAILESAGKQLVPPTLRLYAWDPPCLSLGYAQPISDVDWGRLEAFGWHLVRRPTGGRAILHTDELTYSISGPQNEPRLAGSVLESYHVLSRALLAALHTLTIPAHSTSHPPTGLGDAQKGPVCFEVPSNYEITVDGKKLLGSAQARRREGVLQHGTLPISGDLRRITQVLVFADEAQRIRAGERLLERAATLEAVLGYIPDWTTVADAIVEAFNSELNLELLSGELTPTEVERAEQLNEEKYSNPDWTRKT
jgi:lipoate-protein ligase A